MDLFKILKLNIEKYMVSSKNYFEILSFGVPYIYIDCDDESTLWKKKFLRIFKNNSYYLKQSMQFDKLKLVVLNIEFMSFSIWQYKIFLIITANNKYTY